jgi:hypothetical protein
MPMRKGFVFIIYLFSFPRRRESSPLSFIKPCTGRSADWIPACAGMTDT